LTPSTPGDCKQAHVGAAAYADFIPVARLACDVQAALVFVDLERPVRGAVVDFNRCERAGAGRRGME
jgi:hypothetical protein